MEACSLINRHLPCVGRPAAARCSFRGGDALDAQDPVEDRVASGARCPRNRTSRGCCPSPWYSGTQTTLTISVLQLYRFAIAVPWIWRGYRRRRRTLSFRDPRSVSYPRWPCLIEFTDAPKMAAPAIPHMRGYFRKDNDVTGLLTPMWLIILRHFY